MPARPTLITSGQSPPGEVAGPLGELRVLLVARVRQDLEQPVVAGHAAAVLGRAGALAGNQRGYCCCGSSGPIFSIATACSSRRRSRRGTQNRVHALVDEGASLTPFSLKVRSIPGQTSSRARRSAVADLELVQIRVLPSHRLLDDLVQRAQGHVARDRHPAPDRKADAAQCDLEDDLGRSMAGLGRCGGASGRAWPQP